LTQILQHASKDVSIDDISKLHRSEDSTRDPVPSVEAE